MLGGRFLKVFSTKEQNRNAGDCRLHVPIDIHVIKETKEGQETTSVEELWGGNDMLLALRRAAFICVITQQSYSLKCNLDSDFYSQTREYDLKQLQTHGL